MSHVDNASGDRQRQRPLFVITGGLLVVSASWYLVCEAVAASGFPGYSYAHNYISDLGVPTAGVLDGRELNSHLPAVMNAGFIGEGLLVLLASITLTSIALTSATRTRWSTVAAISLLSIHAGGIVLAGLVPGSPEHAANGLMVYHVIGAVCAIVAGNLAAVVLGGFAWRAVLPRRVAVGGVALGVIGLISATCLQLQVGLLPDGVWERGAVYTIILWHLVLGATLVRGGYVSRRRRR